MAWTDIKNTVAANDVVTTNTVTSFTINIGTSISVGDLIVICLSRDQFTTDSAQALDVVFDNKGNQYSQALGYSVGAGSGNATRPTCQIYWANAAQAVADTVDVVVTAWWEGGITPDAKALTFYSFSGSGYPVGTPTTVEATTATPSTGAAATTSANNLIVGNVGWESASGGGKCRCT